MSDLNGPRVDSTTYGDEGIDVYYPATLRVTLRVRASRLDPLGHLSADDELILGRCLTRWAERRGYQVGQHREFSAHQLGYSLRNEPVLRSERYVSCCGRAIVRAPSDLVPPAWIDQQPAIYVPRIYRALFRG